MTRRVRPVATENVIWPARDRSYALDQSNLRGFPCVPSDAARSIEGNARLGRHPKATRPTIVQQRSTVGVYGHVTRLPPHGLDAVRGGQRGQFSAGTAIKAALDDGVRGP